MEGHDIWVNEFEPTAHSLIKGEVFFSRHYVINHMSCVYSLVVTYADKLIGWQLTQNYKLNKKKHILLFSNPWESVSFLDVNLEYQSSDNSITNNSVGSKWSSLYKIRRCLNCYHIAAGLFRSNFYCYSLATFTAWV